MALALEELASSPAACFILSRLGQCLVHCTGSAHSTRSLPRPAAFCQLIATMLDCSGMPPAAYLELHGWGVVLLSGFRVIVAVLCDPSTDGQPTARLVAMQALNAFGKLHHAQVSELD